MDKRVVKRDKRVKRLSRTVYLATKVHRCMQQKEDINICRDQILQDNGDEHGSIYKRDDNTTEKTRGRITRAREEENR